MVPSLFQDSFFHILQWSLASNSTLGQKVTVNMAGVGDKWGGEQTVERNEEMGKRDSWMRMVSGEAWECETEMGGLVLVPTPIASPISASVVCLTLSN